MYPDFIGIGAQKAGTTWLYRNMRIHPEIWMPPRKEVQYFNKKAEQRSSSVSSLFGRRRWDRELRGRVVNSIMVHAIKEPSLEDLRWSLRYHLRCRSDEWYASLFEGTKGKVVGEITPAYSVLGRDAVAHVHELIPDAKIIFMMRNPIERVWSQAVMSFDRSEERSAESLSERRLLRRIGRRNYRLLTGYRRTLETWGEFYPDESIFVGFLEDVSLFPVDLLSRLYEFLDVDPSFRSQSAGEKVHTRSVGGMPAGVATRIAGAYREEIEDLSGRFGGYADFWLYCAERLIEDPPDGERVTYPFHESELWEEWVHSGAGPGRLWSGPLTAVGRTG